MHCLNSHLPASAELLRAQDPAQLIFLTEQESAGDKTHPQELFSRQLSPHLYFIQPRCSLGLALPTWDLQILGKNRPKLGQQRRWSEVEARAEHLDLFIPSLALDLANNH